ncbi:unnamed protein product [Aphanomyces euteiches]|nr:hypothetical protein AeRB84_004263 [Aphanomyces euteiches]
MYAVFLVWNIIAFILANNKDDDGNHSASAEGGLNHTGGHGNRTDEKWPSALPYTFTPMPTEDNTTDSDTITPVYRFPKFVAAAPLTPVPTTTTCDSTFRRAKSPNEVVYITIDDGPSASGRINLLNVLTQINNRTDKAGKPVTPAYVSFMESGYNFCGPETIDMTMLQCVPGAYEQARRSLVWTIKAGHTICAHSDTHFYDATSGFCNYQKMNAQTKIEAQYLNCGNTTASDFVRGALRVQTALDNETLWETDDDRAAWKKAISTLWTYARLPCTNEWILPGVRTVTGLRREDQGAEGDLRMKTGDMMFAGKLPCKNDTKPWYSIGWDAEWRLDAKTTYDNQKEKCRVVKDITNQFDRKDKWGPKPSNVVLLTHDYFFLDMAKATIFRDIIVELQLLGYTMGTIDKYPI